MLVNHWISVQLLIQDLRVINSANLCEVFLTFPDIDANRRFINLTCFLQSEQE